MKLLKQISLIFLVILLTNCSKDELIVNDGKKPVTYKSGVPIGSDFESTSNSLNQIANPNLIFIKPNLNGKKSGSEDYSVLVEGLNGIIDTIKTNGGDKLNLSYVKTIIPINDEYVMLKGFDGNEPNGDNVTVNFNYVTYRNVTVFDSVSIDNFINDTCIYTYTDKLTTDTLYTYNIIDTIVTDQNLMVRYYDTVSIVVNHTSFDKTFVNLLYNVKQGKYYDFPYPFYLLSNSTSQFRNIPLYFNADRTSFYFTDNNNYTLDEVDLSGSEPKIKLLNSNLPKEVGCSYFFNKNVVYKSPDIGYYISISENGKVDSLLISSMPYSSNGTSILTINNSLLFFYAFPDENKQDVYELKIVNDTIDFKLVKSASLPNYEFFPSADERSVVWSFTKDNTYYYYQRNMPIINTFSFKDSLLRCTRVTGLDPYDMGGIGENFIVTNIELIDNYMIFSKPSKNLYRVDVSDVDNMTAEPFSNMVGIMVNKMTADQVNKQIVFFGYDTNKSKFVEGRIDIITGEFVGDVIESDIDNSQVLISSFKI